MDKRSQYSPLNWDKLPEGDYFYHATPLERLESVKQLGLTTPNVHKFGKYFKNPDYPEDVNDRLFLWVFEKDCLLYAKFDNRKPKALRFKRGEITGASLFKDPLYGENDNTKAPLISFSTCASVPAMKLEICTRFTLNAKKGFQASKWDSLSKFNVFDYELESSKKR